MKRRGIERKLLYSSILIFIISLIIKEVIKFAYHEVIYIEEDITKIYWISNAGILLSAILLFLFGISVWFMRREEEKQEEVQESETVKDESVSILKILEVEEESEDFNEEEIIELYKKLKQNLHHDEGKK